MPFDNSLKSMQNPQRLYSLCKIVHTTSLSEQELKEMFQPASINDSDSIFKEVVGLAEKGKLIGLEDKNRKYVSKLKDDQINDQETFKIEIARRVFSSFNYVFTKFTCWFINRGETVLKEKRKDLLESFFNEVTREGNREFNDTNITAWRVWASFLGLGYQHKDILVPNATNRIRSLLRWQQDLPMDKQIPFKEFMNWLASQAPELDGGKANMQFNEMFSKNYLSYALSSGLRTLHDLGEIRLYYVADALDVWHLSLNLAHEIPDQVSHIEIKVEG